MGRVADVRKDVHLPQGDGLTDLFRSRLNSGTPLETQPGEKITSPRNQHDDTHPNRRPAPKFMPIAIE